jgi:HAD superfamily hydrolase (TIGR01509 family)
MDYFGFSISSKELEKYVGMTNPEMWLLIKSEYNLIQSVDEIINYQLENKINILRGLDISPIEGIKELLVQLKNHAIPVGIASSSPKIFIEEVLKKFDLVDYFMCIVSGEEVPRGKPAPDVYIEAAKQLGINVEKCVVIEDSRNGVISAKNARMKCIGYKNINSGNQNLSQADIIVNSIKDINIQNIIHLNNKIIPII